MGVMGNGRTYDMACAPRAAADGMTVDVYPFDMSFLTRDFNRIVKRRAQDQSCNLRPHRQTNQHDRVGVTGRTVE
jgi:hypothetical protein